MALNDWIRWIVFVCLIGMDAWAVVTPQWVWEDPEDEQILCLDIDSTGTVIAAGTGKGNDGVGVLAVFDWRSPWPILREEFDNGVVDVDISDDGQRIACVVDHSLHVFELPSMLLISFTDPDGSMTTADFDASGNYLVASRLLDYPSMREGGRIYFFDVGHPELLWSDALSEHVSEPGCPRLRVVRISDDATNILVIYEGGLVGDPAYAALYRTDQPTPDIPVWITQPYEPNWVTHGALAGDGQHFVVSTANTSRYFDMSPPIDGIKEPLWTFNGGGFYSYTHHVDLPRDGRISAHIGPYHFWQEQDHWGVVEIVDGATGNLRWTIQTEFQGPSGDLSGDGSRIAYSATFITPDKEQKIYLADVDSGEVVWSADGIGYVGLDEHGTKLIAAGGRVQSTYNLSPLQLFCIEENEPPACSIVTPQDGDTVGIVIELFGLANDPDGYVHDVEVVGPHGIVHAESIGDAFRAWHAMVDLSGTTDYTIMARAIDDRYKHGAWDQRTVIVQDGTPTAMPTWEPTPTPPPNNPTPTASPIPASPTTVPSSTPDPVTDLDLELQISANLFYPGDVFSLQVRISNPEESVTSVPVFVILEIHGAFFCWPSWQSLKRDGTGLDYDVRDVPSGEVIYEIIPPFLWPEHAGSGLGLLFYGALVSPTLDRLITDIDFVAWGYME